MSDKVIFITQPVHEAKSKETVLAFDLLRFGEFDCYVDVEMKYFGDHVYIHGQSRGSYPEHYCEYMHVFMGYGLNFSVIDEYGNIHNQINQEDSKVIEI